MWLEDLDAVTRTDESWEVTWSQKQERRIRWASNMNDVWNHAGFSWSWNQSLEHKLQMRHMKPCCVQQISSNSSLLILFRGVPDHMWQSESSFSTAGWEFLSGVSCHQKLMSQWDNVDNLLLCSLWGILIFPSGEQWHIYTVNKISQSANSDEFLLFLPLFFLPGLNYNMAALSRWRVQTHFCVKWSWKAVYFIYWHNLLDFRYNLLLAKDLKGNISGVNSGDDSAKQLPIHTKSLLTRMKTDKSIKDNRRCSRWATD